MTTFAKILPSGSPTGLPLKVNQIVPASAVTVHSTLNGVGNIGVIDEVWLYAANTGSGTAAILLSLCFNDSATTPAASGTDATNEWKQWINPGAGLQPVLQGVPFSCGQSGSYLATVIKAYASSYSATAGAITLFGWVHRITP
jgi:hypothetical protein